jgi:mono/diheme cytochrome c family protein
MTLRPILALLAVAALAACNPDTSATQSARAYDRSCAGCHGPDARGGPAAPDLTGLARRDGTFPRRAVLERLDSYGRGAGPGMPDLSQLMAGRMVPVDLGDGTRRVMPGVIAALAAYLERQQR